MKLSLDRTTFLKALSHGQSVVERRTTIPILSHVLLETLEDSLLLVTTDSDLCLRETIPAQVMQPGAVTVAAHMIFDIVRKIPDHVLIHLELDPGNEHLILTAGRSRFSLATLSKEQFPDLSYEDLPHQFEIESGVLKRFIDRAKFAMSTEDTRYYLNGIYFHAHLGKSLRSVATDAHRLACIEAPLPQGAEAIPGIIISRKTVVEVRKFLEESDEKVLIHLSSQRIVFIFPHAVLSSRLIDGTYPDYEAVIPQHPEKYIRFDAKSFAAAVDRVATVVSDKLRVIKLHLMPEVMLLSAASHELGSALEEFAVSYDGKERLEIGFNAKYLLDIAHQIGDDQAEMWLSDANSPTLLRGMKDEKATFILMPMRV